MNESGCLEYMSSVFSGHVAVRRSVKVRYTKGISFCSAVLWEVHITGFERDSNTAAKKMKEGMPVFASNLRFK